MKIDAMTSAGDLELRNPDPPLVIPAVRFGSYCPQKNFD